MGWRIPIKEAYYDVFGSRRPCRTHIEVWSAVLGTSMRFGVSCVSHVVRFRSHFVQICPVKGKHVYSRHPKWGSLFSRAHRRTPFFANRPHIRNTHTQQITFTINNTHNRQHTLQAAFATDNTPQTAHTTKNMP